MKNNHLSMSRQGEGGNIILLHGWGMNATVFEPLCSALSHDKTVINVDLPGYGESPWQNALSFQDQASYIGENLPEGILFGWSMGGLYASEIARQFPQKFSPLILVCCNPCFVQRKGWNCAVEESVFDAFGAELEGGWQSTVKRFLAIQVMGNANARELIRALMEQLSKGKEPHPQALKFGLELLKTVDQRQLLSELELPIKMIFGERDTLVPNSLITEMVHVNPGIRVESLAFAAHAPFLSHTYEFVAMI